LPFHTLHTRLADHRAVIIPAGLDGEQRERFVTKIAAAARQQAGFSAIWPGVLKVRGDVVERGDSILIPHEPATPLDPASVERGERPETLELWWAAWALLGSLRVSAADNAPHGGIQTGSVFMDETGRLKLSDFGIAPVFEAVCGPESRRQIHCDAAIREDSEQRVLSGEWSLLPEEQARDYGWVAPFFAHELLEGKVRLNPRSDQFAVGTLLFLLATGTHPYEAALSDPTLMFYFVLEPHPLEYGRPDWGEIFERRSKGLSQSADKPILAWSDLVMRLLAADASQRFPNLAEAEKLIQEHIPQAWADSAAALSEGQALLEAGDVEGCLSRVVPWRGHEALPAQWRERLTAWVDRISAQKELIVRRRELSAMLAEAQKHVDLAEASRAMVLAQSVKDAPEAEESHRRAADEILVLCSDIDELNKSEWARGYLDAAQEHFSRREFGEARELLTGLLGDPGTPTARRTQARQLLSEVELAEQRIERQRAELAAAREELEAGKYESARPRLEGLLANGDVTDEVVADSRGLLTELERREGVRARNLSVLAEGREAWERGEAELLEQKLAQVTSDFADPQVAGPSAELSGRLAALRAGLSAQRDAEEALARQDAEAALRSAQQGAAIPGLPAVLAETLAALVQRGQRLGGQLRELSRAVEEEKQGGYDAAAQRIERLLGQADLPAELASQARLLLEDIRATQQRLAKYADQLKAANAAWESGDLPLLEKRLADFTVDPEDRHIVQARQNLVRRAEVLRAALDEQKAAEGALAAGDVAAAHATARRDVQQEDLPQVVRDAFAGLLRRCEQALREIEAAHDLLDKADVAECRKRIEETLRSLPDAPQEIRAPADELLAACTYVERAQVAIREADQASSRGEFEAARARLEKIERARLPAAVQERLDQVQQENQRRAADFVRGQEAALTEKLELARVDLGAGRLEQAEKRLTEVRASRHLNDALRSLLGDVERGLEQVRPIAQTLAAVEKLLAAGGESELAEARARLGKLPVELPPWARERGGALRERSESMLKHLREQRVQAASAALNAAAEAIERGDPSAARQKLEEARPGVALDASLSGRAEQLQHLAQRIEGLLPKVQELRRLLDKEEFTAVAREAAQRFGEKSPPPVVARQLDELLEAANRGIEQRRARFDQELLLLTSELDKAGRRARRFLSRVEAVRGDELATQKHKEQAEVLLRRYEALPKPKMPVAPLAVSGAVALVAIGAALAWFGGVGGSGPTPLPSPNGGTHAGNGPQEPNLVTKPNSEPSPQFVEMDQEREAQARADAEKIRAARDRLQDALDAARTQADPAAPAYRVMIDVPDGRHAQVYVVQEDGKPTAVLLESVPVAELASAQLPETWLAATYPPLALPQEPNEPPVERIRPLAERLVDELASKLGEGFGPPALIPSKAGEYAVEVATEQRALRVAGVRLDEQADRVTPDVGEIAARLQLQREAVATLADPAAIGFELDPAYDAQLTALPGSPRTAEFGELCDPATRRVGLTIAVRLRNDPRGDESFPLSGVFSVGERRLIADENGRAYFRGYLKRLQELAAGKAAEALRGELALPPDVALTVARKDEPQQIELQVGLSSRPMVAEAAPWNSQVLAYQVDVDALRASIARALHAVAATPDVLAAVSASWPALRARLALAPGQAGRGLIGQLAVQDLRAVTPDPATPYLVPVEVLLSGGEALPEVFALKANLRPTGDGLDWADGQLEAIRTQLVAHFDALARDEGLAARRQAAVLDELCREKGLEAAALRASREGEAMKAEWTAGQTVHSVAWSWDRETLDWVGRKDLPPVRLAPPKLEEQLARLSAQPEAELSGLAAAVGEIARRKLERYQAQGLEPRIAAENAGDPKGQLLEVSRALQNLVAPNRARDPFPTIFVEYFTADDAVYGLSWHASTDADDTLVGVHRGRVWKVADQAELLASRSEELRRRYSSPGEGLAARLLAPALEGATASARPGNGSFGVAIAPDGPLWMTRWEQVRIGSIKVSNLGQGGAPDPGAIHTLWDALKPQPFPYDERARVARRRAGLWVVPALAAVYRGEADRLEVRIDRLPPDADDAPLSFRQWGEAGKYLVATLEVTGGGSVIEWGMVSGRLKRENIGTNVGTRFWEYGWEGGGYEPKKVRSLVLLPVAP
jgi:hypothetical protein